MLSGDLRDYLSFWLEIFCHSTSIGLLLFLSRFIFGFQHLFSRSSATAFEGEYVSSVLFFLWPQIRSGFFSVFGPWRGTLFKLSCLSSYERQLVFSLLVFAVIERFITSTCYNQITECIFLYNYFTINSRHSLVRISLFSLGKNIFEPQALFE